MKSLNELVNELTNNQYMEIDDNKIIIFAGQARAYWNATDFRSQYGEYKVVITSTRGTFTRVSIIKI